MDKISIIVPCYNESEVIPFLKEELYSLFNKMNNVDFEVIMIDNSSTDNTLDIMKDLHSIDKRFHYISFSKNFGKDSSMYAGLQYSTGDYVTIIDADLQDPPYLICDMYKDIKNGEYDAIACYREDRKGEPFFRSIFANIFYGFMNKISTTNIKSGARDFRLMTRQMVEAVLKLGESERFTKGIFGWIGFKTKWIPYKNQKRVAGTTKLPMKNAVSYALRGIVAFSTAPLMIISFIGFIFCAISIIYTILIIARQLILHEAVPGYASLMSVILFCFGITFLALGIISQYLAMMYLEIKNRPRYIIKESDMIN